MVVCAGNEFKCWWHWGCSIFSALLPSKFMKKFFLLVLFGSILNLPAREFLLCGAVTNEVGSALLFVNSNNFVASSGYSFSAYSSVAASVDYYGAQYLSDRAVFSAMAATPENGGPEEGAALVGSQIAVRLISVAGPAGASVGFWETTNPGEVATNLAWSVSAPMVGGTNQFIVSHTTNDPFGRIEGRAFSFSKAGLYRTTWQFVDVSTNGVAGAPVHQPSQPFTIFHQAGHTIESLVVAPDGKHITFAAPSGYSDWMTSWWNLNYILESSDASSTGDVWNEITDPINGDDAIHTIVVPDTSDVKFYRLKVGIINIAT